MVELLRRAWRLSLDAFWRFNADDGWAIASHIALSGLMALFPFFLVLTAIAGIFGSTGLADEAAMLMLQVWPVEVAGPIALEIHSVLSSAQGDVLTLGALLALFFASSGIESLRIGLNRAYGVVEARSMWLLRLESIAYVIVASVMVLALSFLVLFAPLIIRATTRFLPALAQFEDTINIVRYGVAILLIVIPLFVVHKWLPAGYRRFRDILPGILATLVLWLVAGAMFGRYLAEFAFTYSIYYAGLASPMIALVFLYFTASIFIYGGNLNAAILAAREKRNSPETAAAAVS